jgi:hypothetical protein
VASFYQDIKCFPLLGLFAFISLRELLPTACRVLDGKQIRLPVLWSFYKLLALSLPVERPMSFGRLSTNGSNSKGPNQ